MGIPMAFPFFFCQHQSPHDPRVLIDLSAWSRYVNTESLAILEFWQIAPSPPTVPSILAEGNGFLRHGYSGTIHVEDVSAHQHRYMQ